MNEIILADTDFTLSFFLVIALFVFFDNLVSGILGSVFEGLLKLFHKTMNIIACAIVSMLPKADIRDSDTTQPQQVENEHFEV